MYGERLGVCNALLGTPAGRGQTGRLRSYTEDNIKVGLKLVGGTSTRLTWLRTGVGGGLL